MHVIYIVVCDQICEKGSYIQASDFVTLKRHNFIYKWAIRLKFLSYKFNDRTVLLPNFKAVGQTQVELKSLIVKKLNVLDPFSQVR